MEKPILAMGFFIELPERPGCELPLLARKKQRAFPEPPVTKRTQLKLPCLFPRGFVFLIGEVFNQVLVVVVERYGERLVCKVMNCDRDASFIVA